MTIRIDGLTAKQIQLLDKLWSLDTQEEVSAWFGSLDNETFKQAVVLQEMILDSILEQTAESDTSMAKQMLGNIGVKTWTKNKT